MTTSQFIISEIGLFQEPNNSIIMKVSKSQGLLYMYDLLCKNKEFTREEVMDKLEIPPLTFHRYVQELKAFLANFINYKVLYYSRREEKYKLVEI